MAQLDPDAMPAWLSQLRIARGKTTIVAGIDDDDCAVLRWGQGLLVITTDYLNAHPIATELGLGSIKDLGRLNVLANLSDLCGSGADPRAFLSAVTMPRDSSVADFEELMSGVFDEASNWDVPVVGGDTKLGTSMAVLGVAVGAAESESHLFLKNRALPGDGIWCSGNLGSCSAAVLGIRDAHTSLSFQNWAQSAILRPTLPLAKSRSVSQAKIGHGGIDISDGLGNDLHRLAAASQVGLVIYADRIPIAKETAELASILQIPSWGFAFGSGGDMQFVVTASPTATNLMEQIGMVWFGEVVAKQELTLLDAAGRAMRLPKGGHRDARKMDFATEIRMLVSSALKGGASEDGQE